MPVTQEQRARLLTLSESADYLGVGRDLIRKAVESGQISTVRLGQRQWISTRVLDQFLQAQGVSGGE
jgi:excisionase family DNA binding protein